MSSRRPHESGSTNSSRKGRLSYLLNHDDEDSGAPDHGPARSPGTSSRAPRYDPSRMQYLAGSAQRHNSHSPVPHLHSGFSSGTASSSKREPGRASVTGSSDLGDRSPFQRTPPKCESPSSATGEKRGVRKKRQRKFVCETCGFGFYTNSDLQKHVSSVHLLLRPYECSMCDKKFGERSNATKHFKSVHERQKNAACDQCHKVFAFRDGLVRHVRLVHENVRNFHCQYPGCGQSFKQSAHLKKHEQVHTKTRPGESRARAGSSRRGASMGRGDNGRHTAG